MTIKGQYDRMKKVDTNKIVHEALVASKETLADINAEQMFTGKRSDGTDIKPDYADLTIEIKKSKGQVTDRVTLHDEGDHYAGLYADVKSDKMIFGSTDEKSESLEKKYSTRKGSIYGLSDPYKREALNQKVRPEFKKRIEAATGLKMK